MKRDMKEEGWRERGEERKVKRERCQDREVKRDVLEQTTVIRQ